MPGIIEVDGIERMRVQNIPLRRPSDCMHIGSGDGALQRFGHADHEQEIAAGQASEAGIECSQYERSEEHTSELQSLMRISYAVFCLKKKNITDLQHLLLHLYYH